MGFFSKTNNSIAVLGDIHFPFHNKKALKEALKIINSEKPAYVVQIGDLYDQYSFSRFTRKNLLLPQQELERARLQALRMWEACYSKSRRYQLFGNHDVRLIKRLAESIPEAQEILGDSFKKDYYTFPNVETIFDDRKELVINGITFIHGYRSRLGDHSKFNRSSTVVGHSHVGGVVFEQLNNKIVWELNAGYLADETAEPMRYRPQLTSKWTLGLGLIDDKGPRFIPLE